MSRRRSGVSGFTMTEMMVSLTIMGMAIAGATAGWAFVCRGERMNSVQSELDMDVRKSMEKIKRDLRLTAMDKMFFYPPGPGPYTAVSFPMAIDNDGDGLIEMSAGNSNIVWDQTVVYHIWTSTPYRLLRTVFEPRDNTLSDDQMQAQLVSVVTNGHGRNAVSGSNARTETVFENLFTWSIYGNGAIHDGYGPSLQWDPGVSFGSFLLTNGTHEVKFRVIGKNAASSGYRIGVDSIVFTESALEREAEAQQVSTQTGAVAQLDYMAEGAWGGNYQLLFPATATGQTFTLSMENDRWEETNFRGDGNLRRKTVVDFDESLSPQDFVVRLEGYGYTWQPDQQTGASTVRYDSSNVLAKTCMRVLVRGRNLTQYGGTMLFGGKTHYVYFSASPYGMLKIKGAFIALAADQDSVGPNAAATGTRLYFSRTQSSAPYDREDAPIPAGSGWWCCPASNFEIDPDKSYVISIALASDQAYAPYWQETHSGVPGSYIITNSDDVSTAASADWGSRAPVVSPNLYAINGIYTTHPTNGTFTSQVIDTKVDTPTYSTITWNADKPYGTSLKIKVRTGDSLMMTNAPAWDSVTNLTAGGTFPAPSRRFVQFQAILDPDSAGWSTPKLKDLTIRWAGTTKLVDVGAVMTKGPNYGICEVTIDGKPLTKGMRIDLTIFEDVLGWAAKSKRLTSSMTTEVDPRNTGM